MKHLHLFEEYHQPLYQKITEEEYAKWCFNPNVETDATIVKDILKNSEEFTPKEIQTIEKKIKSIYPDREVRSDSYIKVMNDTLPEFLNAAGSIEIWSPDTGDKFWIDKVKDEWFYVYIPINEIGNEFFYKCDQLEGLIQFLDDLPKLEIKWFDDNLSFWN